MITAVAGGRDPEVTLAGGTQNRGLVVRSGSTVRRPARRTSPSTRALLDHLTREGFDGAPRWLGIDEEGREVLTYVEGQTAVPPHPSWALTDSALVSVALLLRRFHDAAASFPAHRWDWQRPVPAPSRTPHPSHNDPNLDNVVFRDGTAVALIDFDLAGAGSRVWDLAMAARLWCPLREETDILDARQGHSLERLRLFLEAYGASTRDREALADAVLASHAWAYDHVEAEVSRGHAAFTEHWLCHNARERAQRTWLWLLRHRSAIDATAAH